jgi:hypothetical protein
MPGPYGGEHKMSDEQLRRFQRLVGERVIIGDTDLDAGKAWSEAMDAQASGFLKEEVKEYLELLDQEAKMKQRAPE